MNKKKGFTLVEVLVSITIFLSVFAVILSTYYLAQKRVYKQEETQYIENLCLDIDKIYDNEGYEGLIKHYKFETLKYTGDDSSDIQKEKAVKIDDKYFNDNQSKDDSDSNVDGDNSNEENSSNDDSSSSNNESSSDDSSSNDDSSSGDNTGDDSSNDETEEENQVKKVVKYLIPGKIEENNEYLGTIVKTSENITSTRDENKKEKAKDENGKDKLPTSKIITSTDGNKKYDVSIQEYILNYKESIHNETINKITFQKDNFSKEGSIYLDSNYNQVDSNDSYKYLLTYSYSGYLYEINTVYTISEYTNNVEETFNEYSTTKSYTKDSDDSKDNGTDNEETNGITSTIDFKEDGTDSSESENDETNNEEAGGDNTDSSESLDGYTEDTDRVNYEPTEEEIDLKKTSVKDENTSKVTKMIRTEYIKEVQNNTSLTITITNIKDNYVLIKDLDYESSKYDDTYINEFKQEMEDDKGETDGN